MATIKKIPDLTDPAVLARLCGPDTALEEQGRLTWNDVHIEWYEADGIPETGLDRFLIEWPEEDWCAPALQFDRALPEPEGLSPARLWRWRLKHFGTPVGRALVREALDAQSVSYADPAVFAGRFFTPLSAPVAALEAAQRRFADHCEQHGEDVRQFVTLRSFNPLTCVAWALEWEADERVIDERFQLGRDGGIEELVAFCGKFRVLEGDHPIVIPTRVKEQIEWVLDHPLKNDRFAELRGLMPV